MYIYIYIYIYICQDVIRGDVVACVCMISIIHCSNVIDDKTHTQPALMCTWSDMFVHIYVA